MKERGKKKRKEKEKKETIKGKKKVACVEDKGRLPNLRKDALIPS